MSKAPLSAATRDARYQAEIAHIAGVCQEIITLGMAAGVEPECAPTLDPLPCPVAEGEVLAGIERVFEAITEGHAGFGLMPCNVNGQPAAMIALHRMHRGQIEVAPCFVSFVPGMVVRDADGFALFGGT